MLDGKCTVEGGGGTGPLCSPLDPPLWCVLIMVNFVTDPTLTVESLVGVMEKMTPDEGRRKEVWGRVLDLGGATPSSYLDEVYSKYTTAEEKTHALADVYVNIRPDSSWQHLFITLFAESEMVAAKEVKLFLGQTFNGK